MREKPSAAAFTFVGIFKKYSFFSNYVYHGHKTQTVEDKAGFWKSARGKRLGSQKIIF